MYYFDTYLMENLIFQENEHSQYTIDTVTQVYVWQHDTSHLPLCYVKCT